MGAKPSVNSQRTPVVLVAEDDEALRKMIGHMLGEFAEVHLMRDGAEALGWAERNERIPDLIVTDLMMPRLDGLAFVKQVRQNPNYARVPIIILTAKDTPRDVVEGINAGARHYLTKPFKRDELVEKAKKALRVP